MSTSSDFGPTRPQTLINAGTMTGTAVLSGVIDAIGLSLVSLQGVWTGTPQGTFTVLGSNDQVTWTSFGLTITAPGGSAGNHLIDIQTAVPFLQYKYINSSSTGVLTVKWSGKP